MSEWSKLCLREVLKEVNLHFFVIGSAEFGTFSGSIGVTHFMVFARFSAVGHMTTEVKQRSSS